MGFRTLKELDACEGEVKLVDKNIIHSKKRNDLILVPAPTEDPNDPLTWPQWRKLVIFVIISFFTFMTNVSISGLTPAFVDLSVEFAKPIAETANLMVYTPLAGGLGNFVWVPISKRYGKRFVLVLTSLMLFVCNIWSAKARSYGSLLAARLIGFFCGCSTESVGVVVVDDLFFLHERGRHVGVYGTALAWGNAIGPLFGGFVIESVGWRWFSWTCAIATGLNFIAIFLFVPETYYPRTLPSSPTPAAGEGGLEEPKAETAGPGFIEPSDKMLKKDLRDAKAIDAINTSSDVQSGRVFERKPYLESLSVWNGVVDDTPLLKLFLRPFPLMLYPAVIWGTLTLSLALGATIAASTLNVFILQAPPYNFRPGINGLINVAGAVGNLLGALTAGPLTDYVSIWHARRHAGVFIPESRLIVLVLPTLMTMVGQLMFGFGAEKHLHFMVIFVGLGVINYVVSSMTGLSIIYVMDSYHAVAAESIAILNGFKSVFAFGFSYAIVPWVQASGYATSFAIMGAIILAAELCTAVFFVWGKKIRHWTSTRMRVISW